MATPIPDNAAVLSPWDFVGVAGEVRVRDTSAPAVGIVIDSRRVSPGCAFFAIKGESFDGNDFVQSAIERGARFVVTSHNLHSPVADVVMDESPLAMLGFAARMHLERWRRARAGLDPARTVAITGSAGKTTTKQIAAALLSSLGETLATPGNLNNQVGLPMTAFTVAPRHRFAVLELGMSVRGEIAALSEIARPDVAVITNVGVAHAEGVGGTRAHVAHEKGAIYDALGESGTAIVNADDLAARGQLATCRARNVLFFGRSDDADYHLLSVASRGLSGTRITFERPCEVCASPRAKDTLEVDSPLLGEHAAIDFLAALAATESASGTTLTPSAIQSALRTLENASQRGDVIVLGDGTVVIDDSYNANPHSMIAALVTLRQIGEREKRRTVAVLGEMKELGAISPESHVSLGEVLANEHVALAIGCGGQIDLALAKAEELGVTTVRASDAEDAAKQAVSRVLAGDVVLVKASRSVGAERVVGALVAARGKAG